MNGLHHEWTKTSQTTINRERQTLFREVKTAIKAGGKVKVYQRGWVAIGNQAFNGISQTDIDQIYKELEEAKK